MSKEWVTPRAQIEGFTPNEYCSTCWGVACDVVKANEYEEMHGLLNQGVNHTADHCGLAANQVIKDINGDGTPDLMQEVGTDGLGTLRCTLYGNDSYKRRNKIDVASVKMGQHIYWTTSAISGGIEKTWHHQGTVGAVLPDHPNRS